MIRFQELLGLDKFSMGKSSTWELFSVVLLEIGVLSASCSLRILCTERVRLSSLKLFVSEQDFI